MVHITGPGDLGVLGLWVSNMLGIPMVASWHTNLHEYAAERLRKTFSFAPRLGVRAGAAAERYSLRACMAFYRLAHFIMAPNATMVDLLRERTRRPAFLMAHGVDTETYSPKKRQPGNGCFCIGYLGRLTPEKSVRSFVEMERKLLAAGHSDFRLLLVGEGSEREWLKKTLRHGELPGILRGESLAEAFAGMDAFVFPSRTDTFGLVLLEAMASGVPVVVSPETGVRVNIEQGQSGFLSDDFTRSVIQLMESEQLRLDMGCAARRLACTKAWDGVFDEVYRTYQAGLATEDAQRRMPTRKF